MHAQDWFLAVIGFFLPPIPVLIKRGFFSADFWINIALCLLGFLPGLLHSWYIISCYPYESGPNLSNANRITHPGNTRGSGYGSIQ